MERAPNRAMLRAVGMTDDDWEKPQIGIASSWNEITPCNLSLKRLALKAKEGVFAAGGFPMEFGTISVSDGISMGHEGMRASLVSREVIADSVETVMHAERLDGSVTFAGCDKSLPGMLMAAARLDLANVFVYAGSILPGRVGDHDVTIQDAFEGVGACALGRITRGELDEIERQACPGEGACGGMFTANTMASVGEALGMSLPGSAAPAAVDRRRDEYSFRSGEAVVELLRQGITARDIMTKHAFENAIAVVMALGGSTNAVLHLLAIAREAEVELTIDDFNRVGDRTPHLADVKPFGRYVMNDIDRIGGVPVVMRELLDAGLLHGDAMTVTGQHGGREPGRARPAGAGRQDPAPGVRSDPPDRWAHDPQGVAGARRFGDQGGEHRQAGLRGDRQGLRRREGRDERRHPRTRGGWRRRGHPLRRAEGRPRHARDARGDRRHQGRRARQGRHARHRRPVLRSDGRVLYRPRRT